MKINKAMSSEKLDVWECKCGTYTPVKKGSLKPECEYCRRGKEKVLKDLFPNKKFRFLEKDGINYISGDAVVLFIKIEKERVLKIIENYPFVQVNVTKTPHQVREEIKQKIKGENE